MKRRAVGKGSWTGSAVALALLLLGALAAGSALAGCSIDRRSSAFACQGNGDCESGRMCIDQLCVVPNKDAGGDCPQGCTRCEGGTCYVDCTSARCDNFDCPAGFKCNITCGTGRCTDIDCGASDCDVLCEGANACIDVDCGTGKCNVVCSGRRSCTEVTCDDSCGCQVTCDGLVSCTDVTCPMGCNEGNGCSSTAAAACNTCS